jgi:hypothetical protein
MGSGAQQCESSDEMKKGRARLLDYIHTKQQQGFVRRTGDLQRMSDPFSNWRDGERKRDC